MSVHTRSRTVAPYLQKLVGVMKYAAPLAGPVAGVAVPTVAKVIENDIKLMTELVKKLPDLEESREVELAEAAGKFHDEERVGGAALRAIRTLLDGLDESQYWGGLENVLTPEGHHLWLCKCHKEEYRL